MAMLRCILVALATLHGCSAFDREGARISETVVAAFTPMKNDQSIDLEKVPAYAEYLVKWNFTNVLVAGTTGESLSLTVDERKMLTEAWVKAGIPLGLKIYSHIGAESIGDVVALTEHAVATQGVSGLIMMSPVYFKPTVPGVVAMLKKIASVAPNHPLWYYHVPAMTGVLAGEVHEILEAAQDIPNLMGAKFTDYNLMDFLKVSHNSSRWNMIYGRDEQLMAAVAFGADAMAGSTFNFLRYTQLTAQEAFAGNHAQAFANQLKVAEVCLLFANYPGKNVQKAIMRMVGMDVGPPRLPKFDLDESEYVDLFNKLSSMNVLYPSHMVV